MNTLLAALLLGFTPAPCPKEPPRVPDNTKYWDDAYGSMVNVRTFRVPLKLAGDVTVVVEEYHVHPLVPYFEHDEENGRVRKWLRHAPYGRYEPRHEADIRRQLPPAKE